MKLFINGSNRKHNSYNFLKTLVEDDDLLLSLDDLNIKYCIGCNGCQRNDDNTCILNDDMKIIYDTIDKVDKIIIMSPIYMNHITGILKNIFDRFNPYVASEKLRNKKIMLLTVGQMSEEEQQEIVDKLQEYFESLSEFLYFDFEYLYNFTSGDVIDVDNINKMYTKDELDNIVKTVKNKINKD